eukprot:5604232-Amphidinium_carterae.1
MQIALMHRLSRRTFKLLTTKCEALRLCSSVVSRPQLVLHERRDSCHCKDLATTSRPCSLSLDGPSSACEAISSLRKHLSRVSKSKTLVTSLLSATTGRRCHLIIDGLPWGFRKGIAEHPDAFRTFVTTSSMWFSTACMRQLQGDSNAVRLPGTGRSLWYLAGALADEKLGQDDGQHPSCKPGETRQLKAQPTSRLVFYSRM